MRRGFLSTSPPVFVCVVVSTFIVMKTLLRGCRWWSQDLEIKWLCESSLKVLTRWSISYGPLRTSGRWCSSGLKRYLKGHVGGQFLVFRRLERPVFTWVWNSWSWILKGSDWSSQCCKLDKLKSFFLISFGLELLKPPSQGCSYPTKQWNRERPLNVQPS